MSEIINYALTGYFTIEMIIKIIGLGLKGYLRDRMNTFDAVIVLASLIEIIVGAIPGNESGSSTQLSVLRAFRLMRIFKLARSWKELNKIINTVFNSLQSIVYLSFILLLFMFITALLGM